MKRAVLFQEGGSLTRDDARPSGFGLPADLLEKARTRLTFIAFLFVCFCIVAIGLNVAFDKEATRVLLWVYGINGVFSLILFLLGRSRRIRHDIVLNLGLVYEVLLCLVVSFFYLWSAQLEFGSPVEITWTCILIVMFPLLIPCPPRRTLITALSAASTVPIGFFVLDQLGMMAPDLRAYILYTASPLLCVVIAVAGSRLIYRLNVDIAEAARMGSYRLRKLLGRGGMGEVWQADHKTLARPAAVKLVSPGLLSAFNAAERDKTLERFEREAQVTAKLNSPHTVELYDFGVTDDGTCYYVMELLDGFDLENSIGEKFGAMKQERVVHILLQICDSLADAHHNGLVHRDIKPANIFLCRKGLHYDYVKVLDFGLVTLRADPSSESTRLTRDGFVGGTPAYMAPEVAKQPDAIDARADIYSLGCVAFWLLTGRTVFLGDTPLSVILAHVNEPPPVPSSISEIDIDPDLEQIIMSCLEKEPARRPQSVLFLAQRLEATGLAGRWTPVHAREWWGTHRS